MKTKTLILILGGVLLLNSGNLSRADELRDLERSVAALDARGKDPADHARVFASLSVDTGVPVPTLEKQKAASGLGFGGVFIANKLASATGKTFDQIAAEHQAGRGWGEIAKANDLKLGSLVSAAKKSDSALSKGTSGQRGASGNAGSGSGGGGGKSGGGARGGGKK